MMHRHPLRHPLTFPAVIALMLLPATLDAPQAHAARGKSVANEAEWVSFDPEAKTVTVKILMKSNGNEALAKKFKKTVRRGREVTINVIPDGPIRERTSVAINGRKAGLLDIDTGKRVVLYWIEDPNAAGELFARKIDVLLSFKELRRRYETEGAEE
ncbi:MAG: hypothetical protein GY937_00020 [bacterium]|nr:hypothetical protein [bacterium]